MYMTMRMFTLIEELKTSPLRSDSNATRDAIMRSAERMFGELGLRDPPLHTIVADGGRGNKFAVQYHFKDRTGLIKEIMIARLDSIARRRAELALIATTRGLLNDVSALVEAMYIPVIEEVGDQERHSFHRFLLQVFNQPWSNKLIDNDSSISDDTATRQIKIFFDRALPHLASDEVTWRMRLLTRFLLANLIENDNRSRRGETPIDETKLILDTFDMITASFMAGS
jgi:AcrR family transcriptional regulator